MQSPINSNTFFIWRRELRSYFMSPIAYVMATTFFVIIAWMFFAIFSQFGMYVQMGGAMGGGRGASVMDQVIRPLFGNINVIIMFITPFITLRLFAEERRNNTIELLFCSPVSWWQMVLGKYLAAFTTVIGIVCITVVMPLLISWVVPLDWGVLFSIILGTTLMIGVYVAVGAFASSLTENPLIAGFLAMFLNLLLWIINWAAGSASGTAWSEVFNYLSLTYHFEEFSKGIITTKAIGFYVSQIFFWLLLTVKSVESQSWRS